MPQNASTILISVIVAIFTNVQLSNSTAQRRSNLNLFLNPVPGALISGSSLQIFHSCRPSWRLIVIVTFDSSLPKRSHSVKVLDFPCSQNETVNYQRTPATVNLPRRYACQPQYWLHRPPTPSNVKVRLWLHNTNKHPVCELDYEKCYSYSRERISYAIKLPPPFKRNKCLNFNDSCASSYHQFRFWSWRSNEELRCETIHDSIVLTTFPVYFEHEQMGLPLEIPAIHNREFRNHLTAVRGLSKFTISIWIYIQEYCSTPVCAIYHGMVFFDQLTTPLILLTNEGKIQIGVASAKNVLTSAVVLQKIPHRQWVQLVLHFGANEWKLFAFSRSRERLSFGEYRWITPTSYDVTARHLINIGGSDSKISFNGLVGETIVYRGFNPPTDRVVGAKNDSVMFNLRVTPEDFASDCKKSVGEVNSLLMRASSVLRGILQKNRCETNNPFIQVRRRSLKTNISKFSACFASMAPVQNWTVYQTLKNIVFSNLSVLELTKLHSESASRLFDFVKEEIQDGKLDRVPEQMPLLHQAHCLGLADATFLLSVVHSYGVGGVQRNATEALRLLLLPRVHGNRLIHLAAAHRLDVGMDGGPVEPLISFLFHQRVAAVSRDDYIALDENDVLIDYTRLTNAKELQEHTGENEDLFEWIKHQADRNVPWAKRRLATMWYWGTRGIRRNMDEAMKVYRSFAASQDAEPEDNYNYGVALLKDSSHKKQVAKAVDHLKDAAEKRNPQAINALAWVAERHEHNLTKAAQLYREAHEMGFVEASSNLGVVFHTGRFPGFPRSFPRARQLFEHAGRQGNMMGGYMYARYLALGVPNDVSRNMTVAKEWMRFTAEKNVKIGRYLFDGIKAYKQQKIMKSFINLLQAAYTGIEIGNFNLAVLCEDHKSSLNSLIEQDCSCFHYNMTLQRDVNLVTSQALLKVGDCLWFGGKHIKKDENRAIHYYTMSASKHFPQAFFNLGYLMEQGFSLPDHFLEARKLKPASELATEHDNLHIAHKLYVECEKYASGSEAQLPCHMARLRLNTWIFYLHYNKVITFLVSTVGFLIIIICVRHFRI